MLTEHNKDLYKIYFGKNSDYYLRQMEGLNKKCKYSFSVVAFLFGLFWMAYRKMYKQLFIILLIVFVKSFIEIIFLAYGAISPGTYENILMLSALSYGIIIGSFANRLYIRKSKKDIENILDKNFSEERNHKLIERKGGVEWVAPIILLTFLGLVIFMSS